jgi:hypothetical protein
MRGKYAQKVVLGTLTLAALFLAACEGKSINQILADPHRYSQRQVAIRGTVLESYSVAGRGVYRVDDGTGRLWVVSENGVPRKGTRIAVLGKIKDGYNIGDFGALFKVPERFGNGLVMVEKSHKAQN